MLMLFFYTKNTDKNQILESKQLGKAKCYFINLLRAHLLRAHFFYMKSCLMSSCYTVYTEIDMMIFAGREETFQGRKTALKQLLVPGYEPEVVVSPCALTSSADSP